MSYYPEPNVHISDKIKVVLDLTNYASKRELNNSTCVNTSNLPPKSDFKRLSWNIIH